MDSTTTPQFVNKKPRNLRPVDALKLIRHVLNTGMRDERLSATDRAVLTAHVTLLLTYSRTSDTISNHQLGMVAGISDRRTVRRAVVNLQKLGYVDWHGKTGRGNPPTRFIKGGVFDPPLESIKGGQPCTQRGGNRAPKGGVNHPPTRNSSVSKGVFPGGESAHTPHFLQFNSPKLQQRWQAWIASRAGQRLDDEQRRAQFIQLKSMPEEQAIEHLTRSTAQGIWAFERAVNQSPCARNDALFGGSRRGKGASTFEGVPGVHIE